MEFYDAHSHKLEAQTGGFLIGLDGEPKFEGILSSVEAVNLQNKSKFLFAVEYINCSFKQTNTKVVKYHPRREKYLVSQVIEDIKNRLPNIVIIDTLNQPYWQPLDYWQIALQFKEIQFVFCHAGGYDIHEFLKIANFSNNVWLDFSLTQEYFGWCGDRPKYLNITNAIDFALSNSVINKKILFGSDNGFFSQLVALQKYLTLKNSDLFLKDNFLKLIERAKIC